MSLNITSKIVYHAWLYEYLSTQKLIQLPYEISSLDSFDTNQKLITNITKQASYVHFHIKLTF